MARTAATIVDGDVLFRCRTSAPLFALTFDDGPSVHTTPGLLDALAEHGARATFFVLGSRAEQDEDLTHRIVSEGHELGNHTWDDEPSADLDPADFVARLDAAQRVLARHGGTRWFRPGSGWTDRTMLREVASRDLRCVLGSAVAVRDHGAGDAGTGSRLARATGRGSILVLHEGTPERRSVNATVRSLLTLTDARGLRPVGLSELVIG
ncbi:polysaccharide deacetylase family protein [Actinomycetospora sp.]|jgi:peptidoglycan/xylan/chitin deacetylase (PgdA/CDA1 family)|uniref:polysaccharide deacetylase family protein n=1 Tax=Actinomycetospora sp. TaxID=1872135 RepID=UPI002F41A0D5